MSVSNIMDNFRAWFTSYEQNDEEDYCPLFSPPPPLPPPSPPTGAPPQGVGCTITNHHKFDDEDDAPYVAIQQPDATLFFRQQQQQQHVLMPDNTTTSGKNKGKNTRRYKSSTVQGESSTSEEKQRRMMHRDIERQRRQEMASLYASLRNQLPLEYIKGKRSVSDHVMEAVRYIEHKQKSIRELEEKRDMLRSWSKNDDEGDCHVAEAGASQAAATVTVRPCLEGVEILISCGIPKLGFRVSRALHLLGDQQGLQLLSCVCSRVDDTLLHTIRAQVSPHARVDFQELQRNLIYALNS
ncbi:hypothetical protein DM860_016059 [Cuscuta australis]|uniref:BHLH domain-containing protein n=1 Tax=Cuscuta australis TaxID=267555 RepID=A0A328E3S5_9ASTE|nr:hypothetical protein DM860_016059 [Cuscuta australis]